MPSSPQRGANAKKAERAKAQAKALESGRIDPSVVRLQGTLEENLFHFINHIAALLKDYNVKLEATKVACKAAHAEMGVDLTSTILDAGVSSPTATGPTGFPATTGDKRERSGTPKPADAPSSTSAAAAPEADGADDEVAAAAAAIAARVKEADERRKTRAAEQQAKAAAAAGAPEEDKKADASAEPSAVEKTVDSKGNVTTTVPIVFPDNSKLLQQLELLKKEAYALGTTFDGIHDWVALSLPDFKEEDNLGVEVMGAVIQQVSSLQDSVREVYATELKYLEDRSDLEKALLKIPDSDTIQRQMEVLDLDAWDDAERGWRTMVRTSIVLFSMLSKNMKLLREPRRQRHNMFM